MVYALTATFVLSVAAEAKEEYARRECKVVKASSFLKDGWAFVEFGSSENYRVRTAGSYNPLKRWWNQVVQWRQLYTDMGRPEKAKNTAYPGSRWEFFHDGLVRLVQEDDALYHKDMKKAIKNRWYNLELALCMTPDTLFARFGGLVKKLEEGSCKVGMVLAS